MKLNVEKKEMLRGLEMVAGAVAKKSNLPILENVRITSNSMGIRLQATDLELGVSTKVTGKVEREKEGDVTVPFRQIYKVVKKLPAGEFEKIGRAHV